MIYLKKILANWFLRIVIIILLLIGFSFFYENTFNVNSYGLPLLIFLVVVYSLVDFIRYPKKIRIFGFPLDKLILNDFLKSSYLIFPFFFFLIALSRLFIDSEILLEFYLLNTSSFWSFVYMIIIYASLEEVIFRGMIYDSLIERFGFVIPTIIISLLFTLIHANNPNINAIASVNIFLAGICLSIMYFSTQSLWLPVIFHIKWNLFQHIFLGSNISGIRFNNSLIDFQFSQIHPEFYFGGDFGIEASILTSFFLLIVIFISFKINIKNPYITSLKFKLKQNELKIISHEKN